jgi:hypothetical protein
MSVLRFNHDLQNGVLPQDGAPLPRTRVPRTPLGRARARVIRTDVAHAAAQADLWLLGNLATQVDRARAYRACKAAERAWRALARLLLAPITPALAAGPGPNLKDGKRTR